MSLIVLIVLVVGTAIGNAYLLVRIVMTSWREQVIR